MRCTRLILMLTAALAASAAGCASAPKVAQHTALTSAEIAQIRSDQAERARGQQPLTVGQELGQAGIFAPVALVGIAFDGLIIEPIGRGIGYLAGDTEKRAALRMVNPDSADARREGIYRLSDFMFERDFGVRDAYINYMIEAARVDKDYTVRAAALRTLNRFRIKRAVPAAIADMEFPESLVRLEAAKVLANIRDTDAMAPLIRHLQIPAENADVRIACADALRNFDQVTSTDALVDALGDSDFSVAYQAHQSLRIVTFHDFQYDKLQWQAYLSPANRSNH